jgi:hypothetical protein
MTDRYLTGVVVSRRVRCLGRILSLAARDFILGQDVDAFNFAVADGAKTWTKKKSVMEQAQDTGRCKVLLSIPAPQYRGLYQSECAKD